ncbi:MAG: aminotransferase class I/II-fold pyridoxal phosphate-dependent enzyme [Candidatus Latescibacteria bacterium]|nr:aminotransferase class I/II-fold pyridoxal phosphate-dependent enzyme [bacterium]MBD3425467.1 aminotransferase class I/II-fold pyridoxal phosphate-dependent enzyme [Candidatus Latescibacterota bacterium]
MNGPVSKRASGIEPSVTLSLNTKANELKEAGEDVIGLAAGEPDFQTPDVIKESAIETIRAGDTRYTPAAGISELRREIASAYSKIIGVDYQPSEVMVSNGAKHCIFNALYVLTDPGDEVAIFTPYWVSYPEMVKLVGATPRIVELDPANDYKLTVEGLKNALAGTNTRVILYNSPNNPAGIVYDRDQIEKVGRFLLDEGILLISDEIYEFLTYAGCRHYSPVSIVPELKESTVVITGVSKSYSMTGWRIGFALGNREVIYRMGAYQAHATGCPNAISQRAAVTALREGEKDREKMRKAFQKRREMLSGRLSGIPSVKYPEPDGAFYFLVDVSALYGSCGVDSSTAFCDKLLEEAGLLLIPGGPFGCDDTVRFSFAVSEETLDEALNRFEEFVKRYAE